jgi:hypothetical protein
MRGVDLLRELRQQQQVAMDGRNDDEGDGLSDEEGEANPEVNLEEIDDNFELFID